jgi:hypothetical protein
MLYNLTDHFDKKRFTVRANKLYKDGKTVELTERKPVRSLPQNRYLHLILGWFGLEYGCSLEFVKTEFFKRKCNGDIFVETVNDRLLGNVNTLKSSAAIDTGLMTTAIERFRNWSASEAGIYLPEPNEDEFLKAIEQEINRHKNWI